MGRTLLHGAPSSRGTFSTFYHHGSAYALAVASPNVFGLARFGVRVYAEFCVDPNVDTIVVNNPMGPPGRDEPGGSPDTRHRHRSHPGLAGHAVEHRTILVVDGVYLVMAPWALAFLVVSAMAIAGVDGKRDWFSLTLLAAVAASFMTIAFDSKRWPLDETSGDVSSAWWYLTLEFAPDWTGARRPHSSRYAKKNGKEGPVSRCSIRPPSSASRSSWPRFAVRWPLQAARWTDRCLQWRGSSLQRSQLVRFNSCRRRDYPSHSFFSTPLWKVLDLRELGLGFAALAVAWLGLALTARFVETKVRTIVKV